MIKVYERYLFGYTDWRSIFGTEDMGTKGSSSVTGQNSVMIIMDNMNNTEALEQEYHDALCAVEFYERLKQEEEGKKNEQT